VVFPWSSGFLHQWDWRPRYSWNIVESGVKHHQANQQTIKYSTEEYLIMLFIFRFSCRWYVYKGRKKDQWIRKFTKLGKTTDLSQVTDKLYHKIDSEGRLRTKHYYKRDDFQFHIVNLPFICSNIPAAPAYGVFTESGSYPWSFVTQIFHSGQQSPGFEVRTST
jgi:hypothetical protein